MPSRWTTRTRWAAAVVVAALACARAGPLRAEDDVDETERRLKLAGVAEDVRARIREVIERGVKYLLARQSKDGAFRGADAVTAMILDGETALASLALAHAGGAAARRGAELGLSYLLVDGEPRKAVVTTSYDAGLTAMLVAALHGDASVARRIGRAVALGLDARSGWWGYAVGGGAAGESSLDETTDFPNLSTTQFAALGLWAAGREGGVEYPRTWRRHLESLCANQTPTGSWSYWPVPPRAYPTGTCMGTANLALALAALAEDLADDPVLAARAELTRRRALAALHRDAGPILDSGAKGGVIDYYSYYALEKACVFNDLEKTGGRAWYLAGAGRLVAAQREDGSWPSVARGARVVGGRADDIVSTSFALLFLLRASETYRPVSPRDVSSGPVTPSGDAQRRPAPSADPAPPAAIPQEAADRALDRLDALATDRRAAAADLVRALDDVARVQRALGADAPSAWRDREERLVLGVFDDAARPTSARRDERVAIRAAAILGDARPAAASGLRSALADALRPGEASPPSRAVLGAAFGALVRLGGEATFDWLVRRVTVSTEPVAVRAARASLGALAAFDGVSPANRVEAVARIVRTLEPVERAAAEGEEDEKDGEFRALVARNLMNALGAAALTALERLCADARTGEPPCSEGGKPLLGVADYARWFASHRDPAQPPWR